MPSGVYLHKPHSEATIKKIKDHHVGMLGKHHTKTSRDKMSKSHTNKPSGRLDILASEVTRKNISKSLTGRKLSKEHIHNCLKRRNPSSLEIKFNDIKDKLNLPYKFVGNGEFFIERKNPDFINTNGAK